MVNLGIKRPGTAQDDELDFVDGMAVLIEGGEAVVGLEVRVKEVSGGALGAGFVGYIAFGHADVVGAENAFARTGKGFGEEGDGGDTTLGADGFFPEFGDELVGGGGEFVLTRKGFVAGNNFGFGEKLVAGFGEFFD